MDLLEVVRLHPLFPAPVALSRVYFRPRGSRTQGHEYNGELPANAASLDRSYVGQIERGEVNVSIDNIGKLAKGLKVEAAELFGAGDGG